jgi:hypothetical protein
MQQRSEINQVLHYLLAYGLPVKENLYSYTDLLHHIADYVDYLINTDFNKLVQLLYQLDVSEDKVRKLLKEQTDEPASNSIAKLIIVRQQEKIQMRASSKKDENINENESW